MDGSDCDWRMLQQIEGMSSFVSGALGRVALAESVCSLHAPAERDPGADQQGSWTALACVRRRAYDVFESEQQHRLDTVLGVAAAALGWLQGSDDTAPLLAARAHAADDNS